MTVAKLRGARDRKRNRTGAKVEGRKSLAEKVSGGGDRGEAVTTQAAQGRPAHLS